jgi:hypothetical protein
MTIAAQPIGEPPIAAQPTAVSTGKPPRRRQTVARPDPDAQPEAR